ncbi:MAG: MerR family transcriptional regulator [Anaerocolumna sp.]
MEYTIKQVAERTNLTPSALRYYDKEGLIPQLKRSTSGIRKYTDTDICWIELICCLKTSGMSIERIKEFMNLCLFGPSACEERKELLEQHRDHIIEHIKLLTCSLSTIEYKIEHYKEIGVFHIDG